MNMLCGLKTISVRVWRQRVLVGIMGSGKLAMMSENQENVACRTLPLPLAVGHCWQTYSPVSVVLQEGQFQTSVSQMLRVSLMCLCTARLKLPSMQRWSLSRARPDTVTWSLEAVHL